MAMVVTNAPSSRIGDLVNEGDDGPLDTAEDGDHAGEAAAPLGPGVVVVQVEEDDCDLRGRRDSAV